MHERLARQIRGEMNSLIDRYDVRLREIPGYAELPQQTRHDLERRILELIADCLETNNDQSLIGYVRERAGQVLAAGFKPEWFQQALAVPEEIVTPLVTTLAESNFVWRTLNRAQQMTWHIVAEDRMRLEHEFRESLERRSRQVQTSTEVAQHAAAAPELGELFHRVVTLIKERFNYYHVQLFRYEPAEDAVKLITGYGEIGQKMLAAGHKLTMGRGVVGTAAATGQSILAVDVTRDLDWRPNPNLPKTRGELAVPIKLGGSDAESQANALKHFVNGNYDGMAVIAIDPEAVAPLTRASLQRGKPVVTISSDLGQDNQTALVFAVEHELGYLLGVQAGNWAKQYLPGDQIVKLGMLNYRTLPQVIQREMGIIDGIQSVIGERVTIIASGSAVESKEAAYLTEGWLRDHPDLNMIVAINDAAALGAYQAAQASGRHDSERFFIGGIDAVPEALAAIQEGEVYQATVNQPPEIMGIMAVRTLVAAIKGISVKPVYTLYCAPVNRSNVAEFSGPSRNDALLGGQDIIPAESFFGLDVSGIRLGLSVLTLANPFFATLVESARKEAQRLGVQLVVNDPARVLGVLDVQTDQPNSLTDDDRLLLEGMCGQIASAMESTRVLEELRQSETELSTALKIAKLAYWEYDVEKDRFLFNDQFYSIFHTTAEQQGGYQLSSAQYAEKFVHPDDLAIVGPEIEKALTSTEHHYSRWLEHRILYADGGIGYISVNVNVDRDEQGRILRYYGATQDITERKLTEEALREVEERFRVIAETSPIPILISRVTDGTVLYGNDHLGETFGIPISDLIGRQTPDFYFDMADRLPLLAQLKRDGILRNYELHVKRADGTPFWVLVSMRLMSFEGQPALLSAFYDITERKQIEEALRRNEAQLSEALKIAKLAYWEYDVEKDLFLFNDQFFAIFHTTVEQAGGYHLSSAQYAQQFVHPDDLAIVGAEIEKALHSTDQHYSRQLEHRILYGDGGVGYISVSVNIDRDEQGRILRYYGANQDITERRQVEEALAQEQSLMRALMDSVTDTIYFKDLQSRFLRISRSQANRFHLGDPAQATGKTDFDFFTEEHAWPAYEDEQEIVRTGQPISREERETWADRPDSWALTNKYPLRNEAGHIIGTFGRSVDITERKLAEAERERLLTEQQRRTVQLQTAAEVSRAASSMLNTDKLLPQAVDLIRTRFNLYYVGIFLLDETERWAILRAGTGEAGRQMLTNNHRLKIGGNSMISRCVSTQQAQIALDVGEEAVRFENPLLPRTRSEMALPLVSRSHVMGAMTIQSDQPAAFTADDITVLQSMADQISNAVDNARLYEQAQAALQEVDTINRRLTGEAWDTYLRQHTGRNVIWTTDDEATAPAALPELDEQLTAGEIIIEPDPEDESEAIVTAPVLLRGQPIGAVRLRMPLVDWDDDTETLLADITGHIAQAVENARLIEQTQRTAQRERTINEINARVRQSIDLDAILRTAVNELGQSLGAARVVARVGTSATAAGDGRGKPND